MTERFVLIRQIQQAYYEGAMEAGALTVDVSAMVAGTYLVKVTDQSGATALVKMVKK